MKALLVTSGFLFAAMTVFANDILLECGGHTKTGFNGWYIAPFGLFTNVNFSDETIDFFSESGGNYTISLTRKIESMAGYRLLDLSLKVNAVENCTVNQVDLFVSADGKTWKSVPLDQHRLSGKITNDSNDLIYIRFAINASFSRDGFLQCAYFKLAGESEFAMQKNTDDRFLPESDFFVFCFNRSISVETRSDQPYEIVFSNLAGQLVYSEKATGSTRIEPDLPEGVYIVAIVQDGQFRHTRKIVL